MAVDAVRHAADEGILVGLLGQQRQQFADADAAHVGGDRLVQRAAVVVAGLRLGIEGVEVRRAAPHPDLDDRLRLGLAARRRRGVAASPGGSAEQHARRRRSRPRRNASRRLIAVAVEHDRRIAHHGSFMLCLDGSMPVKKLRAVDQRPGQVDQRPRAACRCRTANTRRAIFISSVGGIARKDRQVQLRRRPRRGRSRLRISVLQSSGPARSSAGCGSSSAGAAAGRP